MMWELTMDPSTGRPMSERVFEIQQQLKYERETTRGVGGDNNNPWIDRGPNNIGGRTRGIMFDPNDTSDYNRVFAGGVSGGLWVNDDITNASSSWTQVAGISSNVAVNVIISDPNNSNIFYLGTGESYTSGAAVGNGIWKSTDGGVNWTQIFGGAAGTVSLGGQDVDGIFYINDIVARDMGSTTELYAAVSDGYYQFSGNTSQWNGLDEMGVYKSTDNGSNWTRFNITHGDGTYKTPADLEIDINNNIWFSTTNNQWGNAGGEIYRSTNGTSFSLMHTVPGANRTEIECSQNNANTLWVAASISNAANLYTTTNAFTNVTQMNEPNDADLGISQFDFTRGQAWYDLVIEADASDNLIVGGIDLFRSTDNGANWSQISKWSNNANLNTLNVSFVHADQHAIVFRPGAGNANKVAFGTDGGVFYSDDITTAATSTSAIGARNQDYNTMQFYYGAFDTVINGAGDDLIGGTQDNGTPAVFNAAAGANGFTDLTGDDGAYTEIDDSGNYLLTSYTGNNHYVILPPSTFYQISTGTGGDFINHAELDNNLEILYSNASTTLPSYAIERTSNFTSGAGSVVNATLTNALLNSRPTALKVSPYTAGSTKLFVGLRNSRLLRIDNADGASTPSWTNITGPGFVGSISDIEFGVNEMEIFVTMHNYGITSIWFTNDGGANWQSKEGDLPDVPVKCILQNPLLPDEVIIGTELGVWATADYTQTSPHWFQTYNGMSDVTVVDLDVRSDNAILASTHGRGMFTSQFTSSTLSIADNAFDDSTIKIYPTVSNGQFTMATQRALGEVSVDIFDLNGKRVHSTEFEFNAREKGFDLNLNQGLYIVQITSDNSTVTKRIIIK